MKTYALNKEMPELAVLIEEVKHGEEIILTDHDCPVAKIVSLTAEISPRQAIVESLKNQHLALNIPKAGCLKGFWVAPDFDEPLDDFKEYME